MVCQTALTARSANAPPRTRRATTRARTCRVLRSRTTFPGRRAAHALGVLVAEWPRGAAAVKGVFEDKQTLITAVSDWVANEATAEETHGAISGWDTSRVDDLLDLFRFKTTFNAQLNWDTSKVTNMEATFYEHVRRVLPGRRVQRAARLGHE